MRRIKETDMAAYSKYTSNNVSCFSISSQSFILAWRERERESKRKREKGKRTRGRGSEGLWVRKEKARTSSRRGYRESPHHCAKEAPKQMETQHVSCGTQPVASVFVPLYS